MKISSHFHSRITIIKPLKTPIACHALLIMGLCLACVLYPATSFGLPDERLRQRLEIHAAENKSTYHNFPSLSELYENWQYEFQWVNSRGSLNQAGDTLLKALANAHYLGLNPSDYHLAQLTSFTQNKAKDEKGFAIDIELLLSDALVLLLKHNYSGRVNSKTAFPEWFTKPDNVAISPLLRDRISGPRLEQLLEQSEPQSEEYQRLKTHLRRLIDKPRGLNTAFTQLTATFKLGDSHPTIGTAKLLLAEIYRNTHRTAAMVLMTL